MSSHVSRVVSGGILSLTLQRPEKKNALTDEMYQALYEGFEQAQQDPDIRCVLLTGAGGCFTSGNDLESFLGWRQPDCILTSLPVIRLIRALLAFDKPVVCAVEGLAIGFGTTVLLHCDLVVSAESTRFQLPFVKLGLVPEFGSTLLLPMLAGRARAAEACLLGEPFDCQTARDMGLVNTVVTDGQAIAQAQKWAGQLAAHPPDAVMTTKALMRHAQDPQRLNAAIDAEIEQFGRCLRSSEHNQALQAMVTRPFRHQTNS